MMEMKNKNNYIQFFRGNQHTMLDKKIYIIIENEFKSQLWSKMVLLKR